MGKANLLERLHLAAIAAPRARSSKVRLVKKVDAKGREVGEMTTVDVAEAVLRRADVELSLLGRVGYCHVCKEAKLGKRNKSGRCYQCGIISREAMRDLALVSKNSKEMWAKRGPRKRQQIIDRIGLAVVKRLLLGGAKGGRYRDEAKRSAVQKRDAK